MTRTLNDRERQALAFACPRCKAVPGQKCVAKRKQEKRAAFHICRARQLLTRSKDVQGSDKRRPH